MGLGQNWVKERLEQARTAGGLRLTADPCPTVEQPHCKEQMRWGRQRMSALPARVTSVDAERGLLVVSDRRRLALNVHEVVGEWRKARAGGLPLTGMSGLSLLLPDYVDRDLHRLISSSVLEPVCGVPILGPAHSRTVVRSDSISMISDRSLQDVDDAWSVFVVVNRAEDASRLDGHHTHSKLFGSVDQHGKQVDDGTYAVSGSTLKIGEGSFRFRIQGRTLMLKPLLTSALKQEALADPLGFHPAGYMVAVAVQGHPWNRVACSTWC